MPGKKTLRIGIVGCGGISRAHARAYGEAGGARVTQVYDISDDVAIARAKEYGASPAPSLQAMVESGELDAVSVCTPPVAHTDNCAPFLKAGIPVLCEKPLEVDAARAGRLATLVRRTGTPFMVAFCHRFHPPVIAAKRVLARGTIGRPLLFRCTFAGVYPLGGNHRADPAVSGGGCVADNAAHAVDLYRFLVGEVRAVQAQTAHLVQRVKAEDFGMLFLKGDKGSVGEVLVSYSTYGADNVVQVFGSRGTVTINYWVPGRPDLVVQVAGEKEPRPIELKDSPDRFVGEVRHFLDCVRRHRSPSVTIADGLRNAQIITAAYASADTGRITKVLGQAGAH